MRSPIRLFIALAVLLAATVVAAQVYKWVDKDGKVQFSDQPPPDAKTEAKKVDVKPASGSGSAAPAAASKSLKEQNKDSDKRKKDAAEKEKKAGDEEKIAQTQRENCDGARANLQDLESGRPLSRTNAQGERVILSDEQRAADVNKARAAMADNCK